MFCKPLFFLLSIMVGLGGCGASSDKYAADRKQIEDLLETAQLQQPIPGIAAAWISSDRIVIGTSGVRRLGHKKPIQPNDVFALCSNTKTFTGMLGASLEEDGLIRWDTTLAEAFPELAQVMHPAYSTVTLTQILKHRAGIIPLLFPAELAAIPPLTGSPREQRRQFVEWALQVPPSVTPGEFEYSNGGYAVASAMMELAGNAAYEQLLQQRILKPLKLRGTFAWPDVKQPWGHELFDGVLVPIDPRNPDYVYPQWANAAGNLSMSVPDYARFAQVHLRALRGKPELLAQASYERLHDSALPDGFGLGWALWDGCHGKFCNIHIGGSGTFSSFILVEPTSDRAVIILANTDNFEDETLHDTLYALALDIYSLNL